MFVRDFGKDLQAVFDAYREGRPFALARFNDGEAALLRKRKYKAASGWKGDGATSWIREPLLEACRTNLDGFYVGISDPTTLVHLHGFYLNTVKAPLSKLTFAMLFGYANYVRAHDFFTEAATDATVVGCTARCDVRVPANASKTHFDVDDVVDQLLDRGAPVLLAAGPAACLIAARYWERTEYSKGRRVPVVDVGAVLDPVVHGKETRTYHAKANPLRRFSPRWPDRTIRRSGTAHLQPNVREQRGSTRKDEPAPTRKKVAPKPGWARQRAKAPSNVRSQKTRTRKT